MSTTKSTAWAACALVIATACAPAGATVCVVGAGTLSFGLYDILLLGTNDTAATITVTCTPGVGSPLTSNYTITIAGTGVGGDTVRSATSGGQRLYYQVFKDAGRTMVWGNGSADTGVSSSVTSATAVLPASQTHTAYARAAPRQVVAPGIYLGSLLVTVDY